VSPAVDLLAQGSAALARADWPAARMAFERALAEGDDPQAHDGLGLALWWLNDIAAAHYQRTRAFIGYQRAGNIRRAAWLAAWLAREQVFLRANGSAMNGWFARAERLIADAGECAERGWVALYRASMSAPPPELEQTADTAMALARRYDDPDLETLALAFAGMAAVAQGRIDAGIARVDEAMAVATSGQLRDPFAVCETFCVTLSACELAGDWARTEQWCAAAAEYAERTSSPFLSAYCRTTYGAVLIATGRWQDAEQVLNAAIAAFDAGHQGLRVHAVLKLADLRVCQGRIEEAEVLLAGYEDYGSATMPRARLHLARGEAPLARAMLTQALAELPVGAPHRAPLLRLCVDVHLALGDAGAAQAACAELEALAAAGNSPLLRAEADLARGLARRAAGDPLATESFRAAVARLNHVEQSIVAGRARLEMARQLLADDPPGAIIWARAAHAGFTRIGATRDADEAAQLLRHAGAPAGAGPQLHQNLTRREQDVLALLAHGLTNREIAARLVITEKTAEHHVGRILSKLGLRSRAEAAAYAVKNSAS
jgi:ATP/maltotriose-dependent transcriptional regulator MalT